MMTLTSPRQLACVVALSLLAISHASAQYPKLLVNSTRIAEIAAAIAVPGSAHAEAFAVMKADVDANATSIIGGGDRQSSNWNYGRAFLASRAAMIYAVTGNTSYADIAYDALYAVHNDPDPDGRLPESGYGLARATVGTAFAIAYDLCYNAWSQAQRDYIRSKILVALDAWVTFSHANLGTSHDGSNWVAVCRGAELLLMLAADEQVARAARFSTLKGELINHLNTYGNRGWGQEGNAYVPYALRFLLPCVVALRNIGDTSLDARMAEKSPHLIAMYAGGLMEAQSTTQWGVGGDKFPPEGYTSLLLGTTPAADLPYYKWFYDRYRGPLNPAPAEKKYDHEAAGNVYALMFYPQNVIALDPTGVYPTGIADDKGGYWFRSRWSNGDDLIVSLGTDTVSHDNAWDEADALQVGILGFGSKFAGGPGTSARSDLFSQLLVDGMARSNSGVTGAPVFFNQTATGGYAIASGGTKYTALGVTSANRHVMVDYPRGSHAFGLISTLDVVRSFNAHTYDFQLNTQGLPTVTGTESGLPTFTVIAANQSYLKGWVVNPAGTLISTDGSLRCTTWGANADIWVVMAVGRGSAPVANVTGSGLAAQLRIGDRLVSYNATQNRILSTQIASGPPTAAFTSNVTSGVSPLVVSFNASSSTDPENGALTYAWDFGDGGTATGVAVTHSFAPKGDYLVRLTVTDPQGNTSSASRLITATSAAPVARFTSTPSSGSLPLNVTFNATTSTDADGHALSYSWDFGDGTTGTGAVVAHTYTTQGLFYPVLTANDGNGETGIAVGQIAAGNQPPVATVTASVSSGLPPLAVTFNASGSTDPESNPLTYSWNFGDGTTGTGAVVNKTFTNYGEYTVTVTANDGNGNNATASTIIRVANHPPKALFTASSTAAPAPATVTFNASASADPEGEALTYSWDFGDGTTGSGAIVNHSYANVGNYDIVLRVTDARGAIAESSTSFSALDALGQRAPDVVTGAVPGIYYEYFLPPDKSFPDFNTILPVKEGVTTNINHLLRTQDAGYAFRFTGYLLAPVDGEYTLYYNIRDSLVFKVGATKVVNETARLITTGSKTGNATMKLKAGLHRLEVLHHFGEISQPGWQGFFDLTWKRPDRANIQAIPAENLFWKPGRPRARFSCSPAPHNMIVPRTVNFVDDPEPGIWTFYSANATAPLEVSFDGGESIDPDGSIVSYAWDFGNGSSAGGRTASQSFSPGNYVVTLTVRSADGETSTAGGTIRVLKPPTKLNRALEPGKTVIAGGEDPGSGGYAVNAFDGIKSGSSRWLVYAEENWIELHLKHAGQRQSFVIDEFGVTNPDDWSDRDPKEILFQGSNDGVNWTVLSHQQNLNWNGNVNYTWIFSIPNNQTYSSFRWDIVPRAESPQGWIVEVHELEIFDNGTGNQPINRPPTASFTGPTSAEAGITAFFNGSASTDPDIQPLMYFWDFGDGQTERSYIPTAAHRYTVPGNYTVKLTVRDPFGGLSTSTRTLAITASTNQPPTAVISASPTQSDTPTTVTLNASASNDPEGQPLTYRWDFGDGTTAEGPVVNHIYGSGIFTVLLTVTDSAGAEAFATQVLNLLPGALPRSIAINFARNNEEDDTLKGSEYAGLVPAANWNTSTANIASGLLDSLGNPTPAGIAVSIGTSRQGFDGTGTDAPNERLLRGMAGHTSATTINSTVSGIPYARYDIYVYWGGVSTNRDTGTFSVANGGETKYLRDSDRAWDGVLSESTATSAGAAVDGHEVVVFRDRTGPVANITTVGPDSRSGPAAIQIVNRGSVSGAPTAVMVANQTAGLPPLNVEFNAAASVGEGTLTAYRWDWESDGTVDLVTTLPFTTREFTAAGNYVVTLTVVDSMNRTGSTTIPVSVTPVPTGPVPVFSLSPASGPAPLNVTLNGSASYDQSGGNIVRYDWDWTGDGIPDATGAVVNQTFPIGLHTVRLTVEDNSGEVAVSAIKYISVARPPASDAISVNFGPNTVTANQSAGAVPLQYWNNLSNDTLANLTNAAGQATGATLSLTGAESNYISADDPTLSGDHALMSSYRGSNSGTTPIVVQVNNLPPEIASYPYDVYAYFGRKTAHNGTYQPEFTLNNGSTYVIKDTIDTWDGTHDRSTATTGNAAIDGHNYVVFQGVTGSSFTMNVVRGSGVSRHGISGIQIVRSGPSQPPVITLVSPATPSLTLSSTGEVGVFHITATDDTSTNLSYAWSKVSGPGSVLFTAPSQPATNATFSQPGDYVVRVTVTDEDLIATTQDYEVIVQAPINPPPSVALTGPAPGTVHNVGSNVALTANATDDGSVVSVAFLVNGTEISTDTNGSNGWSAVWTPAAGGNFTLAARATDNLGADTTSNGVSVTVQNVTLSPPTATLTVSPAMGLAPLAVTLNASGSSDVGGSNPGIAQYHWDFDNDGTIDSTGASATQDHNYASVGNYTARVMVVDLDGLTANATANVTVGAAPVFTQHPANATVVVGQTVNFTATASGVPAPTYQWRANGTAIPGATIATLSFTANLTDNGKIFDVVATNIYGNTTSNASVLTVKVASPLLLDEAFAYGGSDLSGNFGSGNTTNRYGDWEDGTTVLTYRAGQNGTFASPGYDDGGNPPGALQLGSNGGLRVARRAFTTANQSGTFWVSAQIRKGSAANGSPVFIALSNSTGAYDLGSAERDGFGLSGNGTELVPAFRRANGTLTLGAPNGYATGVYHLLLAKVTVGAGADTIQLWIKKSGESIGATEVSLGAPSISLSDAEFGATLRNVLVGQQNSGNSSNYVDMIRISSESGDAGLAQVLGQSGGAANTPPTITAIGNQSIEANGSTGPVGFTVGDQETPPGNLSVSALSSNGTLLPPAGIVLGGNGSNRTITLAPAANRAGATNVTVTVSDGELQAQTTFTLTVNQTFESWIDSEPGVGNLTGPLDNPDIDTLLNLLDYALGGSAGVIDIGLDPAVSRVTDGGQSYLQMVINRDPDVDDVVFVVEVSSDLVNWHSGPPHTTVVLDTPGQLIVRDNTPTSEAKARFIRLRVTQQ